jgi:hypothetical protein
VYDVTITSEPDPLALPDPPMPTRVVGCTAASVGVSVPELIPLAGKRPIARFDALAV